MQWGLHPSLQRTFSKPRQAQVERREPDTQHALTEGDPRVCLQRTGHLPGPGPPIHPRSPGPAAGTRGVLGAWARAVHPRATGSPGRATAEPAGHTPHTGAPRGLTTKHRIHFLSTYLSAKFGRFSAVISCNDFQSVSPSGTAVVPTVAHATVAQEPDRAFVFSSRCLFSVLRPGSSL